MTRYEKELELDIKFLDERIQSLEEEVTELQTELQEANNNIILWNYKYNVLKNENVRKITIKTEDDNSAKLNIPKGTKYTTVLLGIEMLIESILNTTDNTIDDLLMDLRRIYIRDNE